MLAVGDNRQHGGNAGYDDEPSVHYSWDDTVPLHGAPQRGDVIVLWDKKILLGASVIEEIQHGEQEKELFRCPLCTKAGIKERRTKSPKYKCYKCTGYFDEPVILGETVRTYRTRHEAGWVDLAGQLSGTELRQLCLQPQSQLSLRRLDYSRFREKVRSTQLQPSLSPMEAALEYILSGHRTSLVRVRRGQGAFRGRVLTQYRDECAFTGRTPVDALEAAHLYSYAASGVHHLDGGLLMRRDVHRLFDLGHLAVRPNSLTVDVSHTVKGYPDYGRLHDEKFRPQLSRPQVEWMHQHWAMHRT
jgi:predicted RNA-binding Zn-ribbon protein involved in translation (DUF1610 family)